MAPLIINNDEVQGETFLPGHIFVFGGFALRANSLGHLEQIESYAPGHQVRFGNSNYTADIRGDLIFDGFKLMPGAPHDHDEHDLALPLDSVREITPATTPTLNPEQIVPSEDGWIDPSMEATLSVTPATTPALNPEQIVPSEDGRIDPAMEAMLLVEIEPNTDFTPC